MNKVRKLQYIGGQFLINVPSTLVKENAWKKGVWLEINPKGSYGLEVKQVADGNISRTSAELEAFEREATALSAFINAGGANMSPGEYSALACRLSHVQSQIRKLRMRLNPQIT